MLLNKQLRAALINNQVALDKYKPAYDGESIGLDLYHASNSPVILQNIYSYSSTIDQESILFEENKNKARTLIPTGLRIALPKGWGAFIEERGSIIKTPLIKRAGVIDPGYTDQIFVNMVNLSHEKYVIGPYAKLPVQLVIKRISTDYVQVSEEEFSTLVEAAKRQQGKVGSSD